MLATAKVIEHLDKKWGLEDLDIQEVRSANEGGDIEIAAQILLGAIAQSTYSSPEHNGFVFLSSRFALHKYQIYLGFLKTNAGKSNSFSG